MTLTPTSSRATTSGGGDTVLSDTTLSDVAASFDLTSISQDYTHLLIRAMLRSAVVATSEGVHVRLNNDTGANYSQEQWDAFGASSVPAEGIGATSMRMGAIPAASSPASSFGYLEVLIPFYTSTAFHKALTGRSSCRFTNASGGMLIEDNSGVWFGTPAAVTRVTLVLAGGSNFVAASRLMLYGVDPV